MDMYRRVGTAICAVALFWGSSALAVQPLEITSVELDFANSEILIHGINFDNGNDLEINLSDIGQITSFTPLPNLITASFPVDVLPPGNYLLTVTTGGGSVRLDEMAITIGAVGPEGPQGDIGPIGPAGPQGDEGPAGPQGEQGIQGIPGPTGPQGDPGPQGEQGVQGLPGDQGEQGVPGPQGDQGIQGVMGLPGADGAPGPQGEQGLQGDPGPQGEQGIQGLPGDQGEQGVPGPQGDQGIQGPEGPTGPPGLDGMDGEPGQQGEQGLPGPKGDEGEPGPQGPSGINCWDSNGNNQQDANEDINNDGVVSVLDCGNVDLSGLTQRLAYLEARLSNSDFDFDGYTPAIGDCDDSDASINPAAVDVSDDGIDNDCDGFEVTSLDYDGDGYIAIGAGGTDCDDTNDLVNPYQSNFFLTPRSNGTYDYNCDGQETKQYRVCGESDTLFCFGGGVLPECGESGNMATDSYACGPFGFDTCYDINPVPQGCN